MKDTKIEDAVIIEENVVGDLDAEEDMRIEDGKEEDLKSKNKGYTEEEKKELFDKLDRMSKMFGFGIKVKSTD